MSPTSGESSVGFENYPSRSRSLSLLGSRRSRIDLSSPLSATTDPSWDHSSLYPNYHKQVSVTISRPVEELSSGTVFSGVRLYYVETNGLCVLSLELRNTFLFKISTVSNTNLFVNFYTLSIFFFCNSWINSYHVTCSSVRLYGRFSYIKF